MSKKKNFLLLIALFISINLFAYKNPVTKSLKLQAAYGDVLNISVTPPNLHLSWLECHLVLKIF